MPRFLPLFLTCVLAAPVFAGAGESPDVSNHVQLETSHGVIVLELDPLNAPITVENFLRYVGEGHYHDTVFHRVIDGYMIQGGGFILEDGMWVERQASGEGIRNESNNGLKNLRGSIAMARTADPNSARSQFFINVADNPALDFPSYGGYAVFGKVVGGMEVVDRIQGVETGDSMLVMRDPETGAPLPIRAQDVPLEPVTIRSAAVMVASPAEPEQIGAGSIYYWLCPLIALLAGSVPFGLLIARGCGVDIRAHGSGNIGATNVLRVCGKKPGITCLVLDLLKGFIPVVLAVNLLPIDGRTIQLPIDLLAPMAFVVPESGALGAQLVHILTALAAVIGHNHSPWVGFKGGKGVATSAGVLLALMPVGVLCLLVVWLIVFLTSRYVSLASVAAAVSLPLMTFYGSWTHGRIQDGNWNKPLFVLAVLIAAMVVWKHRSNLQRLRSGTENRFEWRKKRTDG